MNSRTILKHFPGKFLSDRALMFLTMLGIAVWWVPALRDFQNMYGASHWALSYEHGLLRRGLVGTVVGYWLTVISIRDVYVIACVLYAVFLLLLMRVFSVVGGDRDPHRRLFQIILVFVAAPATLALSARNLGRLDLFLIVLFFLSMQVLANGRHLWLVPMLMSGATFIHESFAVLYVPTLVASMIYLYLHDGKDRRMIRLLGTSVLAVLISFAVLMKFGDPDLGVDEFWRFVQSRASFPVTELSIRACYYGLSDHLALASPYLSDPGSMANMVLALLVLSPVMLVLANLWGHALPSDGLGRWAGQLMMLATLSGVMLVPIATDYGRWLSAIVYSNVAVMFLLVRRGALHVENYEEYTGTESTVLFALLIVIYLWMGPFHDWNPYPYQHDVLKSSLILSAILVFDLLFYRRWRMLRSS